MLGEDAPDAPPPYGQWALNAPKGRVDYGNLDDPVLVALRTAKAINEQVDNVTARSVFCQDSDDPDVRDYKARIIIALQDEGNMSIFFFGILICSVQTEKGPCSLIEILFQQNNLFGTFDVVTAVATKKARKEHGQLIGTFCMLFPKLLLKDLCAQIDNLSNNEKAKTLKDLFAKLLNHFEGKQHAIVTANADTVSTNNALETWFKSTGVTKSMSAVEIADAIAALKDLGVEDEDDIALIDHTMLNQCKFKFNEVQKKKIANSVNNKK